MIQLLLNLARDDAAIFEEMFVVGQCFEVLHEVVGVTASDCEQ